MPIPQVPELEHVFLDEAKNKALADSSNFPLFGFFYERKTAYDGTTWFNEIMRRVSRRGQSKALGAPTQDVPRDAVGWEKTSPFHFGEGSPFTQDDLNVLNKPGTENKQERAEVVNDHVENLTGRHQNWKHDLMASVMSTGKIEVNENGVIADIDFAVPKLNTSGTYRFSKPWNDPDATIITDILKLKLAFRKAMKMFPDTVFYNPEIEDYLIGNAEVKEWLLTHFRDVTVEEWFANKELTVLNGLAFKFAGLRWVPIEHVYEDDPEDEDTIVNAWPTDTLTFARLQGSMKGKHKLLEWKRAKTAETDMTGNPTIDVVEHIEPKALTRVRLHANGIPTINREGHLMIVDNVKDAA